MSSPTLPHPVIVVTDLDGTLLDHYSYSPDAARPAIQRLQSLGIPLIFNTSKTLLEVLEWRQMLGNQQPFIIENGGGIVIPHGYFSIPLQESSVVQGAGLSITTEEGYDVLGSGEQYQKILQQLQQLQSRFDFRYFASMSVEQVCAATSLTTDEARKAMARYFSQPVLWRDTEEAREQFIQHLRDAGFSVLQGGRFLHVMDNQDKGQAMLCLKALYEEAKDNIWQESCVEDSSINKPCRVVALGDSGNDIAMLERADIAVLVRSPVHDLPALNAEDVIVPDDCGPVGWNQAMQQILDRLTANVIKNQGVEKR